MGSEYLSLAASGAVFAFEHRRWRWEASYQRSVISLAKIDRSGTTRRASGQGPCLCLEPCRVISTGIQARRILLKLRKIWEARTGRGRKTYFRHRVQQYRTIWRRASEACGAEFHELADDLWEMRRGGLRVRALNHQIQLDDPVTLQVAGRKAEMHRLLAEAGLPVPEHEVFSLSDLPSAFAFLRRHPTGCVVKPCDGTAAGDGVRTHLQTEAEVRDAAVLASLYGDDLLIELQVPGECYRILVLGGKAVHAVCRRGPRLVGDGVRSVRDLVALESRLRVERGERKLALDREALFTLGWQDLTPESVPALGQRWIVTTVDDPLAAHGELRTVYNTDVSAEMAPEIMSVAERAAAVLGSDFVGIDMILVDSCQPAEDTGGVINEVNTTPALHHHYDVELDDHPSVAIRTLDLAFARAECAARPPA